MSSGFGIIEAKRPVKFVKQDKFIDPDNETTFALGTEDNPSVALEDFYEAMTPTFKEIELGYKFIRSDDQRRMHIGYVIKPRNNYVWIHYIFFQWSGAAGAGAGAGAASDSASFGSPKPTKKILAKVSQKVFGALPYPSVLTPAVVADGRVSGGVALAAATTTAAAAGEQKLPIVLRTWSNESVIEDLITLASDNGVEIVKLPAEARRAPRSLARSGGAAGGASSSSGAALSEEDEEAARLDRELEEKRLAEEKKRQEEQEAQELADARPLKINEFPRFADQQFSQRGVIYLGGIEESDLYKPLDSVGDESTSRATQLDGGVGGRAGDEEDEHVPSDEEMNVIGTQLYKDHGIHDKVVVSLEQVTKFFKPFVITRGTPRQTAYFVSDLQSLYENHFSKIVPLKRSMVKIFPLVHLSEQADGKSEQLSIQDGESDFIALNDPEQFSISVTFSQGDNDTYIHKWHMVHNESGAVKASLDRIYRLFDAEMKRVAAAAYVKPSAPAAPSAAAGTSAAAAAPTSSSSSSSGSGSASVTVVSAFTPASGSASGSSSSSLSVSSLSFSRPTESLVKVAPRASLESAF